MRLHSCLIFIVFSIVTSQSNENVTKEGVSKIESSTDSEEEEEEEVLEQLSQTKGADIHFHNSPFGCGILRNCKSCKELESQGCFWNKDSGCFQIPREMYPQHFECSSHQIVGEYKAKCDQYRDCPHCTKQSGCVWYKGMCTYSSGPYCRSDPTFCANAPIDCPKPKPIADITYLEHDRPQIYMPPYTPVPPPEIIADRFYVEQVLPQIYPPSTLVPPPSTLVPPPSTLVPPPSYLDHVLLPKIIPPISSTPVVLPSEIVYDDSFPHYVQAHPHYYPSNPAYPAYPAYHAYLPGFHRNLPGYHRDIPQRLVSTKSSGQHSDFLGRFIPRSFHPSLKSSNRSSKNSLTKSSQLEHLVKKYGCGILPDCVSCKKVESQGCFWNKPVESDYYSYLRERVSQGCSSLLLPIGMTRPSFQCFDDPYDHIPSSITNGIKFSNHAVGFSDTDGHLYPHHTVDYRNHPHIAYQNGRKIVDYRNHPYIADIYQNGRKIVKKKFRY